MSLNNIIIEKIKENYYRGEFLGLDLVIDKNTGYFNATKLCNEGGKLFKNWKRLDKTKELLKHVSSISRGSDLSHDLYEGKIIYEIAQTNNINSKISGTYVCKELILDIASWISPEFYLKCNQIIICHAEEEYKKKYETKLKEKDCKIDELVETCKRLEQLCIEQKQEREQDRIKHEQEREEDNMKHEELIENFEEINEKLDRALPDRNVDPESSDLIHHYILLKNKQKTKEYMFFRGQDKYIESLKKKHATSFDVIIEKTKNPNPIDLVNRLKEKIKIINEETYDVAIKNLRLSAIYKKGTPTQKRLLINSAKKEHSRISYRLNKITLNDFDENEFLKLVSELDEEKYDV